MIEQRDLDAAVGAGIVDAATAARLVDFTRDYRRGVAGPDEESFRLLTGFNDIFVTIAVGCCCSRSVRSAGGSRRRSARRWSRRRAGGWPSISRVSGGWRCRASRCCWRSSAACSLSASRCWLRTAMHRSFRRYRIRPRPNDGPASTGFAVAAALAAARRLRPLAPLPRPDHRRCRCGGSCRSGARARQAPSAIISAERPHSSSSSSPVSCIFALAMTSTRATGRG